MKQTWLVFLCFFLLVDGRHVCGQSIDGSPVNSGPVHRVRPPNRRFLAQVQNAQLGNKVVQENGPGLEIRFGKLPTELHKHVPRIERSESDSDRVRAAALFAEGRLFYQREQFGLALRKYQRAYRYSHAKTYLLEEIVPLAYRIGRYDEAYRYLMLARDGAAKFDPFVLRQLAIAFGERQQIEMAADLYRMVLKDQHAAQDNVVANKTDPAKTTQFMTWFEAGRINYLAGRYGDAAKQSGQAACAPGTSRT